MYPDTTLIPMIETNADNANILSKPHLWINVDKCMMIAPSYASRQVTESAVSFLREQGRFDTIFYLEFLQNVGHVMLDGFFA